MDKVFNVIVDTINTVKNSALIVNTNDLQTLKFLITINQKGIPVDLTGATVRIAVRKPDKKSVFQDCVITDAGAGKCEVLLLSQAYVVPGLHVVELMVYYAADIVAVTSRFSYTASKGLLDSETVQSTNEFQAITQTLNEVHATVEDLRLNGTGIDAQARQDLEIVTADLAQTETKTKKVVQGMTLSVIPNVYTENNYAGIVPIVYKDGWLWGIQDNNKFVKSNNDGETWQFVANTPYGSVHSIFWTNDGEILISNSSDVRKSVGWSINPTTATWVTKLTKSAPTGVGIIPWGIDGDGQKFIVNEYSGPNRADSRYMWISTDMGNTFNVVLDTYTIDPEHTSHMHGVCYDRWEDRFFVSHGHGVLMRVYWSDNDGATWNPLGGDFRPDAAPTTLTATDNGIVCGSDSGDAGLYGIPRTKNPTDLRMIRTTRWYVSREGVTGFAYRGVRDEKTGQVYVCFKTDFDDIKPVIMAGTATSGATIWESPVASGSNFPYLAVTDNKVWGIIDRTGVRESVIGDKPEFGVPNFDKGNVMTGQASSTSIAIGRNTVATTAEETLIGNDIVLEPLSSKQRNVVIGSFARGSSFSTVIGSNAQVTNNTNNNVAIGANSRVSATNAIAIGNGATVFSGATGGIAIGQGTTAATGAVIIGIGANTGSGTVNATALGSSAYAGTSAVAVGRLASAGSSQVAIGLSAVSNFSNSIALGANVTTTAVNQLNIGERYLEMKKVSEPTAVPADTGRLFVMDDGAGNMRLCVRLGAKTTVLATSV